MQIHWNILDQDRMSILPLLKHFSERGFYLAGGTGLALQIGHRDSIDFDFFVNGDFDTQELSKQIQVVFKDHQILITQNEKNTISCLIDDKIQLSFLGYKYPLLKPYIETEYFPIASIEDIACMKLSAITSRSLEKDYIDLYFILQQIQLGELMGLCKEKFPTLDASLILKSIVFFDDVLREPILFKENHAISFEKVQEFLKQKSLEYFRTIDKSTEKGLER